MGSKKTQDLKDQLEAQLKKVYVPFLLFSENGCRAAGLNRFSKPEIDDSQKLLLENGAEQLLKKKKFIITFRFFGLLFGLEEGKMVVTLRTTRTMFNIDMEKEISQFGEIFGFSFDKKADRSYLVVIDS